jgi:heme/copper-type cytochrome/quinol oxidase subunit 3
VLVAQTMHVTAVRYDAAGRSLGIGVFVLGVVMLIAVFVIAYLDLVAAADGSIFRKMMNLPVALTFKSALLLVMGLVASAIANKGIALYEAARARED